MRIEPNSYDLKTVKNFMRIGLNCGKIPTIERCGLNKITGRFYDLKRLKVFIWIELNGRKIPTIKNSESFYVNWTKL